MSVAAQQNTVKTNGHYPDSDMCNDQYHPQMSIDGQIPGNPGSPRIQSQNYGWVVTALIWVVGGIFTAGTLYSIITSLREDFADQKAQVEKLSETVTRIDERQNFYSQVLQEIRNDVKGIRREQR